MIAYDITSVPAIVVLTPEGDAVARSGPPTGLPQMQHTLSGLVKLAHRHKRSSSSSSS